MKHGKPHPFHRLIPALLAAAYVSYALLASVAAMARRPHIRTIFDLEYDFGPLVQTLVNTGVYASPDGFWTGHRMPLIPVALALVAPLTADALLVTVLKNLVWFGCVALAFALAWQRLTGTPRPVLLALALYILSFPQLVQYGSLLDVEEGYLIPALALLFVALLWADRLKPPAYWPALVLLALLNAGLFLLKSSMLYVSLVFGVAFALRTRSARACALFCGFTLAAALLWGGLNLRHSGQFTLASSYDGLNLYKGNNPLAVALYPPYNLDLVPMAELAAATPPPVNEWTVSRHATDEALRFIRSHPQDALRLLAGRFFVLFFEIRRTPLWEGEARVAGPVQWAGILYMLVFRVVFFAVIGVGVYRIARRRSPAGSRTEILLFLIFVALVGAYAGPYLAGFAYERHVLPLIIPTIAYGAWLFDRRRQAQLHAQTHAPAAESPA